MPTVEFLLLSLVCPRLTEPSKDTCIYKFSRAFSLVSLSRAKASHRPSRLSLVVFLVVLRHSRFPFETDVPELPVFPLVVDTVIRGIFRRIVFIRLNREYYMGIKVAC